MSHIRVVLLKDMPNLGGKGDVVEVKAGFGRNFLLAKKMAVLINSPEAKKLIAENMSKNQSSLKEQKEEEAKILSLAGKTIQFKVKVNKKDKLFKAIKEKDIAKRLEISDEWVTGSPIEELGQYQMTIKHRKAEVKINVDVLPEK